MCASSEGKAADTWKLMHALQPFNLDEAALDGAKSYVIDRANRCYDKETETVAVDTALQEAHTMPRTLFALREARLNTKLRTLYFGGTDQDKRLAHDRHVFRPDKQKGGIALSEEPTAHYSVACIVRVGRSLDQSDWPVLSLKELLDKGCDSCRSDGLVVVHCPDQIVYVKPAAKRSTSTFTIAAVLLALLAALAAYLLSS
eukprot:TRINITY_DN9092_c0_g1_i3.p1 TRINITY_DN9092_c0_g1~~TRINITY_DN9092_c0_g1_i3.p1  ORF type:complete len:201 (+),score=48.29 TRINITY_DN9092_c0_g1_i3:199-801(+)